MEHNNRMGLKKMARKQGLAGHFSVLAVLLAVVWMTGCDMHSSLDDVRDLSRIAPAELVQDISVSPIFEGDSDEPSEYLLRVTVRNDDSGVDLPEDINLLGYGGGGATVRVTDSGRWADEQRGDGVFTALVDVPCGPIDAQRMAAAKDIDPEFEFSFGCSVTLVRPGEECEQWGTCPDRVERSFLWGLIEYETDVAVCWCVGSCDPEFKITF